MKERKKKTQDEKQLLLIVILSILCAFFNSVYGTDKKDSLASSKPAELPEAKPALTFSGYFDTYYFTNFNQPSNRSNLGDCGCARGFDRFANQFQLGMLLTQ